MNFNKILSMGFALIFIVILYLIIYYALKIMYKDVKTGGKKKSNPTLKKYGIEFYKVGVNTTLEEGAVMLVRGDISVGRNIDSDIVLSERFVSGNHAKFYVKNNTLFVEDLNSTNGTIVNGERIQGSVKLVQDNEIKIGSAIFKVLRTDDL